MAKKVTGMVKLQLPAGKANPSPPVGPALGQHGVNIMGFCKEFNAATQAQAKEGLIVPVLITIYSDRSFTFIVKTPPAAILIKKALGLHTEKKKGSGAHKPGKEKVGTLKRKQLEQIAKTKMSDMTAGSVEAAMNSIGSLSPRGFVWPNPKLPSKFVRGQIFRHLSQNFPTWSLSCSRPKLGAPSDGDQRFRLMTSSCTD